MDSSIHTATCAMFIGHVRVDDTVQTTDRVAEKRISREMESRSESRELTDDDALQEEVLYKTLLRGKREKDLEQKVRALFASCSSVTAQENLLVSLRFSPSDYIVHTYTLSSDCFLIQASVTGGGCKKARLCQGTHSVAVITANSCM